MEDRSRYKPRHKETATLPPRRGKIKAKIYGDIKETVINLIGMAYQSDNGGQSSSASANQPDDQNKKA